MKSIVVANRKGGVGKSAMTGNLAWAFAEQEGFKTLLVDFDSQANLTTSFFPREAKTVTWPNNVLNYLRNPKAESAWSPAQLTDKLFLLTCSEELDEINEKDVFDVIDLVEGLLARADAEGFDLVFFDTSPAITRLLAAALGRANYCMPVVELGSPHILEGLDSIVQELSQAKKHLNPSLEVLGILPNKGRNTRMSKEDIAELRTVFGEACPILHIVRNDEKLNRATRAKKPVVAMFAPDIDSGAAGDLFLVVDQIKQILKLSRAKATK